MRETMIPDSIDNFLHIPWSRKAKKIESTIRKALYDFNLLANDHTIAVALSGGKDSMTLLAMLHAISGKGFPELKITAIHIHSTMSCGAAIDANMLRKFCQQLNITCIVKESPHEFNDCYQCARERRKLLFNTAKENGISTIAFGHHRDDMIQTTLMNLFHKGEFAGILPKVPMHKYGLDIIRPLIYCAEQDIITFAEQQGFYRITCRCPVGKNSLRKKTDQMIEDIANLYPNVRGNIASGVMKYGSDKALRC